MSKQKDALIKLEEISKRVGLLIKQYNDFATSEGFDTRLVYGIVEPYSGDDEAEPREIIDFEEKESSDNWNSSGCEWQDSGCSF